MENVKVKLLEQMGKNEIRSIQDLHKKADISPKVLYDLANGNKRAIRLDTIVKLCHVFRCEIGELIVINKEGK